MSRDASGVQFVAEIPRLALSPEEAAEAIGVSRRHFVEHVQPHLRQVRLGRRRVIPVAALERWLEKNAIQGAE